MAEAERRGGKRGVRGLQWRCSHYGPLCAGVLMCSFEKETGCVFGVRTGFRALACVCRVRERETGQRVKVITL